MADSGALSAIQRRAIASLLTSRTVRSAAASAGVGERTLHRWLSDSVFRAELLKAESALIDDLTRSLLATQLEVHETLHEILVNPAEKGVNRLRAGEDLNDIFLRWHEVNSLESRIAALEAAQNAHKATYSD